MTHAIAERNVALVDVLDRLLYGGVVLTGDLTLAIADVDLVRISLRALICPVELARGTADIEGRP
jgi:Gas vesicle protein